MVRVSASSSLVIRQMRRAGDPAPAPVVGLGRQVPALVWSFDWPVRHHRGAYGICLLAALSVPLASPWVLPCTQRQFERMIRR